MPQSDTHPNSAETARVRTDARKEKPNALPQKPSAGTEAVESFDAIVVGAGVSGLYQLYRLRQLGLSVRCFEDGSGVGGTWYWNRYPGCRFDSESETYGYSWSEELLQEWDWKEHFSGQPENEKYLNFVADKFDLRKDIQFNSRVVSAVYDERANRWEVQLESGQRARAQFLVMAVGILSARYIPPFEGVDSFKGESYHTSRWPKEKVDLSGKRVAVIGTGATAVQLIPVIAKEVAHLTVFQRTPNYCAPLRNGLVREEIQNQWKASYQEIHKRIRETAFGFTHDFDPRKTLEVPNEERLALYEELWSQPGFKKWLANFHDIMIDREANEDFAEFVRNKIRQRVKDPVVAEKLVPKDHPFGSKRIPLETEYYEAYNRDNVLLVDIRETPIERITPKGIKTSDREYEFDVIIYATGFDAVTGALTRLDIRGEAGQTLKDKWAGGPRTYLGLQTAGFPNLFIAINTAFCNYTVCAESVVEWITDCIRYLREKDYACIAPTPEAEEAWVEHAAELASHTLLSDAKSWFVGANIPGKARALLLYANTAPAYRQKCAEVAAKGYEGFVLQ
ncbi:MAG TPA: NAD(P)/FAD-dependent oxidoreductase [Candidatus Binatia bacterium]|nr:NAD(P)/FAD-dependent oxidoreductase [Candidatus Binatia bacterium]